MSETLAQHRENPACASCHATFDHFGLVFEGYGPVGEQRDVDFGGRPVETAAEFPDGSDRAGLEGLRDYLRAERQDDFVDNIARRLAIYALGRGLMPSDETLVQDMKSTVEANDYRFSSLVETVVTSPQFLMKRVREDALASSETSSAGNPGIEP